ncbi:hypothetical protein [Citrobacter phage Ci1]|nr:hypothetical protein [Citrobacter phage Ci1]
MIEHRANTYSLSFSHLVNSASPNFTQLIHIEFSHIRIS